MSLSKITLWGIESYLSHLNKSVFDKLTLPDGINKEILINNLMMNLGEFEVLYSDPDVMTEFIESWGKMHYRTFEKWVKAINIEYNPLENYDRKEEWTDSTESTSSNHSTNTANDVVTSQVTAYDSDTYHNRGKDTTSSSGVGDASTEFDSSGNHIGRIHGNIGVTTSQQMLQSELDIAQWNIYQQIIDIFADAFCILVYE